MQPDPAARRLAIQAALLDFQKAPGKHALMQRQPALLFSSIKEVLQLASGRTPGNLEEVTSNTVRQAAAFFVRSALLSASSDHYALLGLARGADAAAIKDRYRLMMRLLHPDFTVPGSQTVWPADTAARVNQAYEVLSSVSKRKAYDESLEQDLAIKPPNPAPRSTAVAVKAAARAPAEDPRRRLKTLSIVFGSLATLALVAILMAGGDRESLVQRAVPVVTAVQRQPVAGVPIEAAPIAMAPAASEHVALVAKPEVVELPRSNQSASVQSAPAPAAAPAPAPLSPLPVSVAPVPIVPPATTQPVNPPPIPAAVAPPPPPVVVAAAAPSAPQFKPGLTMAEVHPLLSRLLQQVESGSGDRLVAMLDREARTTPGTQALLRQYNTLVDGSNSIKVSQVQFKAQPLDGRLLVTGTMLVEVGAGATPAPAREFSLQAEFVSRDGSVQLSRLGRVPGSAVSEGAR